METPSKNAKTPPSTFRRLVCQRALFLEVFAAAQQRALRRLPQLHLPKMLVVFDPQISVVERLEVESAYPLELLADQVAETVASAV